MPASIRDLIHTSFTPDSQRDDYARQSSAKAPASETKPHRANQFDAADLSRSLNQRPGFLSKLSSFMSNVLTFEMRMLCKLTNTVVGHGGQSHLSHPFMPLQGAPARPFSPFAPNWLFNHITQNSGTRWTDAQGKQWHSSMNFQTQQQTSVSAWSQADANGTMHREHLVHDTGTRWHEQYNPRQGIHQSSMPFSEETRNGFHMRKTHDYNTGLSWLDIYNPKTRVFASMSEWSKPDAQGVRTRWFKNHGTGEMTSQRQFPEKPKTTPQHVPSHTAEQEAENVQPTSVTSGQAFTPHEEAQIRMHLNTLGVPRAASSSEIWKAWLMRAALSDPDKLTRKEGESPAAFAARKEQASNAFYGTHAAYKYLSENYLPALRSEEQKSSSRPGDPQTSESQA